MMTSRHPLPLWIRGSDDRCDRCRCDCDSRCSSCSCSIHQLCTVRCSSRLISAAVVVPCIVVVVWTSRLVCGCLWYLHHQVILCTCSCCRTGRHVLDESLSNRNANRRVVLTVEYAQTLKCPVVTSFDGSYTEGMEERIATGEQRLMWLVVLRLR
jgi:hypothetical protein